MTIEALDIEGPLLLHLRSFADERGSFMETWNQQVMDGGIGVQRFVQDNESISHAGVLRGLHFQLEPMAQGKLVRTVNGSVLDVCVDIRRRSPSFGKHVKVLLKAGDGRLLWIPPGFAHGFLALEDHTTFHYKCTANYDPARERTILWNDTDLGIDWGHPDPLVSDKDRKGSLFNSGWDRTAP